MQTLNIFVENIYPDFEIDEIKVLSKTRKLTEFILSQENVFANSCLRDYKFDTLYFDIVLCDNKKIQEINKEYRKKDSPTDVITFAIFADSPENERFIFDNEINLGEIIISLDKIKEQSNEHNQSFEDELYFLIAHGILHCLGFDHLTDEEYNFMINTQNKAKESLGV